MGITLWLWNIDWLVHIGLGRTVGNAAVVLICTFNCSFVSSCPQQAFKKVIFWVVCWSACAGPPWPESSIECLTSTTWLFEQLMHTISRYWWAHFFQFISSCKAMICAVFHDGGSTWFIYLSLMSLYNPNRESGWAAEVVVVIVDDSGGKEASVKYRICAIEWMRRVGIATGRTLFLHTQHVLCFCFCNWSQVSILSNLILPVVCESFFVQFLFSISLCYCEFSSAFKLWLCSCCLYVVE